MKMVLNRLIPIILLTTLANYNTVFCYVLDWKNLHATFSPGGRGMHKMPLTKKDIHNEEYVWVERDDDLNVDLYSYPEDPRCILLFDKNEKLAGIRQTFILAEIVKLAESQNLTFPHEYYYNKSLYTRGRYWGQDLWYSTILFRSPDELRNGGNASCDGLLAEQVYLQLDSRGFQPVPRQECDAPANGYTRQACYDGMGQHYFYQLTPDTDCMDLQGVLLFYEREELVGLAVAGFGLISTHQRSWYDDPPTSVIPMILTSRPSCMVEFVEKYGIITIHLYFKEIPELSVCSWPWQRNESCPQTSETDVE